MMFSRLQIPYFIQTISSFWAASGCRPHLSNHRGHGGTGKGGMRYLSVFQGLQALPPSVHAESAVKHTPLTVKHTRPAVKHSAPAVKHTGAPVEHSPPAAEHSTAAVEHTRQAIERSRATSRQRGLAFKQREPALKQTPQSIQHRRNPRGTEAASQPSEAFKPSTVNRTHFDKGERNHGYKNHEPRHHVQ